MSRSGILGNLLTNLGSQGIAQTTADLLDAITANDKTAVLAAIAGLTGGPLLAVGVIVAGITLQFSSSSRRDKRTQELFDKLSRDIRASASDVDRLTTLLLPYLNREEHFLARLPGHEKADLAEKVAEKVRDTLSPYLPDGSDRIDWDDVRIYLTTNNDLLNTIHSMISDVHSDVRDIHDTLHTGRARLPTIPEGVRSNLAAAGIRPNPDFVGRVRLIEQIHDALTQSGCAALTHALSAAGGVGKSEAAIAYVFDAKYAPAWDGVWWIDASETAVESSLEAVLRTMGYPRRPSDTPELLREELARRLNEGRHLVVLDNLDDVRTLSTFVLPDSARILATTRLHKQKIPPALATTIEVDLLDPDDAARLLILHREDLRDPTTGLPRTHALAAVMESVTELDRHALAIAIAAAALRYDHALTPAQLLDRLRAAEVDSEGHPFSELDQDPTGRGYAHKVAATLLLHLPPLEAADPLVSGILLAASLCHAQAIPTPLLVACVGEDAASIRKALMTLRDRSILQFNEAGGQNQSGLVDIHRLTQSAIRARAESHAIEAMLAALANASIALFSDVANPTRWPTLTEALPHAMAALRRSSGDTLNRAQLLNQIGIYMHHLGRAQDAEPILDEALEMRRRLFKGDHPHIANSLNNLASVRESLGRAQEAEQLYEKALEIHRRLFKGDHPFIANSLNNLALVRESLGRAQEAEPLFQEVLTMRRRLFKGDHPHIANSLHNLAGVRRSLGRTQEAEPLHEEALEMLRRLFKGDHPYIAKGLDNLASVRESLGRTQEAEPLHEEALEMLRRLFKGDHPDIAGSLNNLANVRWSLGRAKEAKPLFQEALEMFRRLFDGDHPAIATNLNNLAAVRESLGYAQEAEPFCEEALKMRRRLFKGDHPDIAGSLTNLGGIRRSLGRTQEAEPLFEEALEMRRRLFKGDHPAIASSLNNLAVCKALLTKRQEALPLAEEAVSIARRCLPPEHPDLQIFLYTLSRIRAELSAE